ncbi:hypothetical protein HAX54_010113 [Datura stramonium]|uniref:Uncharacterized protein n=1 Tax=Datura stramonium TaxID=4076 RepID=A0ABS8TFU1_DATST|nr:hypothetical protein [Datura stramonium]
MRYRTRYDPKGVDVTITKDLEGIYSPVPSLGERHASFDNMPSHLYGMQMLALHGLEESLYDDDATDKEMARVDSVIQSDDDKDDSEIGDVPLSPTEDED